MKVVGCTACPSGVAHTYMAAEALLFYQMILILKEKIVLKEKRFSVWEFLI